MIRLLAAIAVALAKIVTTTLDGFLELLRRLFGGGGALPAPPIKDLQAALPGPEKIALAQDLEIGKAKAAEVVRKMSPEAQVQAFAGMSEDERLEADLTLLNDDQVAWLMDLHPGQYKIVAESSERRVAAALAGERGALTAVPSVGQPDPDSETALASRIAAFRAGTLRSVPAPAYAIH